MSGEEINFGSVEEELEYWKDQALQCRQQWVAVTDDILLTKEIPMTEMYCVL